MKSAPNLKHQPADLFIEAVIFVGKDAFAHQQEWTEQAGRLAGDSVPPVWLGEKHLAELPRLRIVDTGRRCVRVYRAGAVSEQHLHTAAVRLALAGVQEARLFAGIYAQEPEENWTPRLAGLKAEAVRGESAAFPALTTCLPDGADLARMAASERGKVLAAYLGRVTVNPDSGAVYQYQDGIWQHLPDTHLRRTLAAIFEAHGTPHNPKGIDAAIESMRIVVPVLPESQLALVAFVNGVYDLHAGQFLSHRPDNGLLHHNGITFTDPQPGENLHDYAPHFHRWLMHAASGDMHRAKRILAALFMVLANRHDWQLFIEVTGEGGSGKSVFTAIASMLAGTHNTASGNMRSLDEARGRAQFVGKSLIILPDQPRYTGEGTGIKAITGGDPVEIDGKYEKQYTILLRVVILATNNEPMIFTERNGGIARRRVIFPFDNPVSDRQGPDAGGENRSGTPGDDTPPAGDVQRPGQRKAAFGEQRDSLEALTIKRGTDPVIYLCAALYFMSEPKGMMMGGGTWAGQPEPKKYLYQCYLAFMEYHNLGRPLLVEKFARAMKQAAREYRSQYLTRRIKGRTQTNVNLNDQADEFLPRAWGCDTPEDAPPA